MADIALMEKITKECIEWIRNWFSDKGDTSKAVVAISGGKDSTVVAALCVEALGKERVVGVMLPQGEQADISDSIEICDFLGIKSYTINIKESVDATIKNMEAAGIIISDQTKINIPPRERMKTVYAVAQSLNGFVANTCNMSESHVGYSTLFGDISGSFSPLDRLTVSEVIAIGDILKLPKHLVHKVPSDGLCGKTDEDNLGFLYSEVDEYIRTGKLANEEHRILIDKKYEWNRFKLKMIHIDTYIPSEEDLPVMIPHEID